LLHNVIRGHATSYPLNLPNAFPHLLRWRSIDLS
jgi:hypothetical protein